MTAKTTAEKLAELRVKTEEALDPGSDRAKARRDAAGLTPPRVRIAELLDAGSFVEMGQLAKAPGDPNNPFGDGVVTGRGTIDGRPVVVYAHDNTVFGGSVGEGFGKKVCAIMDFAIKVGCPIIGINDSGGARVQDAVTSLAYYSEISKRQYPASGYVPQISIMLGKCAGGAVYAPVTTDFVVAVKDQAYMFVTGPDVIKQVTGEEISMEDLGSALQQARNGNVNHVAVNEHEAFMYVRNLLSYLPSSAAEKAPRINPGLEPEITESDLTLDSIIPDSDNAAYDMHDVLIRMFDDGEFVETSGQFAPNIITGFARVDGQSVGVVANQPLHLSGALDIDASEKATRHMMLCDAYSIPIVYVVDTPGYLPGVQQERLGIIHRGAKMGYAVAASSVPKVTFVVRKAYGGAYAVMGSKNLTGDINLAWPTAQIAVMGAAAAVVMIQGKQLAAAPPEQREYLKKIFMDFYDENMTSPYVAAERGYLDAMIQPRDTRLALRQAVRQLATKVEEDLPKKHTIMPM